MYQEYFELNDMPFRVTPDVSYYYNHASHREALDVLKVALGAGEGFVKITGEVGTGKTLLCRKLSNLMNKDDEVAYIHNPYLTPETLKMALAEVLGIRFPTDITQHHLLQLIYKKLLEHNQAGHKVIVCIDEAQALPLESLEALRLLSNMETGNSKLIQVVLFGQPELDIKLDHPAIRQLKQRITFSYQLKPISRDDVKEYLQYRLNVAGYNGPPIFNNKAIALLDKASHGVPRLLNILAHKSLMVAFGQGKRFVTKKHVRLAIDDTESAYDSVFSRLFRIFFRRTGLA